jgi:hypothetical protein
MFASSFGDIEKLINEQIGKAQSKGLKVTVSLPTMGLFDNDTETQSLGNHSSRRTRW